jgi:hypothetical protein
MPSHGSRRDKKQSGQQEVVEGFFEKDKAFEEEELLFDLRHRRTPVSVPSKRLTASWPN